jgi:hypothetical protein
VAADVAVMKEEEPFIKVLVREVMSFRPATHRLILEHLQPFLAVVAGVLADGVASGEVRDDQPPSQLALLLLGTLTMLYVQHWASEGAWPTLAELPGLAVSAFLDGAGRRGVGAGPAT